MKNLKKVDSNLKSWVWRSKVQLITSPSWLVNFILHKLLLLSKNEMLLSRLHYPFKYPLLFQHEYSAIMWLDIFLGYLSHTHIQTLLILLHWIFVAAIHWKGCVLFGFDKLLSVYIFHLFDHWKLYSLLVKL
jgi:hypothetical protein